MRFHGQGLLLQVPQYLHFFVPFALVMVASFNASLIPHSLSDMPNYPQAHYHVHTMILNNLNGLRAKSNVAKDNVCMFTIVCIQHVHLIYSPTYSDSPTYFFTASFHMFPYRNPLHRTPPIHHRTLIAPITVPPLHPSPYPLCTPHRTPSAPPYPLRTPHRTHPRTHPIVNKIMFC